MAEHGGKNAIGVPRVDGEGGDLLAIAQAEMRPCFAGVGGFVDSVAGGEIGPLQTLAARDVDDVGVGWRDGDRADRLRGLAVEDGGPGTAVVIRLPDAAIDLPHVKDIGLAGNARGGASPAATKGADGAPVKIAEEIGAESLRSGDARGSESERCDTKNSQ